MKGAGAGAGLPQTMSEWIDIRADARHVAREREKARALRKSVWWRQQIQPGVCHYCGKQVGADALVQVHHLVEFVGRHVAQVPGLLGEGLQPPPRALVRRNERVDVHWRPG